MQIPCPNCATSLDVTQEHIGHNVQCPACNARFEVPQIKVAPKGAKNTRPERKGWIEKDHANVNFTKSLLFGTSATVLFCLLMVPFRGTRLGELILERGWVNYAETFLFMWGMTILILKSRIIKHQAQAALLNLFPDHIGKEIHAGNVSAFIENIYKVSPNLRDSLFVNRIRKSLELFEARVDNGEVSDFLSTQSDLDSNRSQSSYSLLKVFLWAIPILGFIGTVMGLSVAVGSLAMGDNADPEALKSSINSLTGGLGIAFDTTLLGLILSMFMSFPLAAVQKKEDETLTLIDTFCTEKLLPKLNDSRSVTTDGLLEQAESIPQLVASLARAHETFLINLNDSTRMLSEAAETLQTRLDLHQQNVENSFEKAITKLSDTSSEIFMRSHKNLERSFELMTGGINQLSRSLRDIGEKGILTDAKKKRGFFSK